MSQIQITNNSTTIVQVSFGGEIQNVAPGQTIVITGIGTYTIFSGKQKYTGVFSGIESVQVVVEETSVDAKLTLVNDNKKEVVVTSGATITRIKAGGSHEFKGQGNYMASFPEKSGNSETLRAIITIDVLEDVDNAILRIT